MGYIWGYGSMQYVQLRNGKFHYYRRVPTEVAHLDRRPFVKVSLKTDSEAIARKRVVLVNQATEEYWQNLAHHDQGNLRERYDSAVRLARSFGFPYQPVNNLATGDLGDLVSRVEAVGIKGPEKTPVVEAVLGGATVPELTIETALEEYWSLSADLNLDKNDDQTQRWRNPRIKAVRNFITVTGGDKRLNTLTREDALAFRDWWLERIREEGLTPNSANKDIGHLSQMVKTVSDGLRLRLDNPFAGLRIADSRSGERQAFEPEYVQEVLLDPSRLGGLNEEARCVLWAMSDTGAGINELCGLSPEDIRLDADVPHILIRTNTHRSLKTKYRERVIPLVGASLHAFQECPNGFPRYQGRNVQLSSTINKFLRQKGLLPSKHHTAYSLRHTFQDRLNTAEVPERINADLMGHKFHRPRYGQGPSLEHKREWLERIAYGVPPSFR